MGKPRKKDLPDLSHLCVPGAEIAVRALPKAGRNTVVQEGDVIRVSVTEAPENGKANAAIRKLLAQDMGTAASTLELRRGAASRDKLFVYTGPD